MSTAHLFDTKAAIRKLKKADPTLGRLIERWGAYELTPNEAKSPYESLLRAVVYQQLHGKAAATILDRVKKIYSPKGRLPKARELIATPDEKLRAAGLSRAKTAALKDLAIKMIEGVVPSQAEIHKLSDEQIVERLTQIRGIGQWTVEMMLMFQLGRPDVLPVTDFGVRAGFMVTYGGKEMPTPKELLAFGERWRPFRSVAAWYLWRAVDLAKAAKVPKLPKVKDAPKKSASTPKKRKT